MAMRSSRSNSHLGPLSLIKALVLTPFHSVLRLARVVSFESADPLPQKRVKSRAARHCGFVWGALWLCVPPPSFFLPLSRSLSQDPCLSLSTGCAWPCPTMSI